MHHSRHVHFKLNLSPPFLIGNQFKDMTPNWVNHVHFKVHLNPHCMCYVHFKITVIPNCLFHVHFKVHRIPLYLFHVQFNVHLTQFYLHRDPMSLTWCQFHRVSYPHCLLISTSNQLKPRIASYSFQSIYNHHSKSYTYHFEMATRWLYDAVPNNMFPHCPYLLYICLTLLYPWFDHVQSAITIIFDWDQSYFLNSIIYFAIVHYILLVLR